MKTSAVNKLSEKKAALYIRVSTQYQIDRDSLPIQRQDLINYAKYALGIDKYEIFEDAGYSAKNTDRPAFQHMMSRLRTGEFSHLLVWKIDRISRNIIDFATMYAEIKKLGITFVSKNEQFDTSNAMGEAMLKIILVFAELERNITSERVTAVMLSRAANGEWNGGRIPYGYDYNKQSHQFTINDNQAAVVRRIYEMYDAGSSILSITRTLNEQGILTNQGNQWSPTTVHKILTNPFYTGDYRYNYHDETVSGKHIKDKDEWVTVPNHHQEIIGSELQARVLYKLQSKRRSNKDTAKTYQRKNIHIFAGILYCGYCNSQMQSSIDRPRKNGYRPSIYSCIHKRRSKDCPNKFVSDITIGPFVLNYIANILKVQNNMGKSTTLDMFEKKLLRGNTFAEISHIEPIGLIELYEMLRSTSNASVFTSKTADLSKTIAETVDEYNLLASEKRKKERALARLKSLYLYDDDTISEREYLLESHSILEQMKQIDKRLEEIEHSSSAFTLSDEEFLKKASVFIMTNELQGKRYIDFENFVRKIDAKIIKEFINSIIQKIVIKDGKIVSIRFRNGIEHRFLYHRSN